ncbi:hypothetical protein [Ornithobacterium rhinotracheale]|uniref:hypothetical protein n=1 Tax=Ornithobacterium rhinotracheale TaxID=28251 RepID=UPI001FF11CD1|nr:hypothetical protein [Ornithobacterium rhinotracheale]MCK0205781.1 hypothetical protein [Ornithobacterium rhinotracheale]
MVLPYGTVFIPGKWEKAEYLNHSRQQYFNNENGNRISIALGPNNKFEFNQDGSKKGFDLLKAYFEWEKEYFTNTVKVDVKLIEENPNDNYLIFQIYKKEDGMIVIISIKNLRKKSIFSRFFSKINLHNIQLYHFDLKVFYIKNIKILIF